MWSVHGSVAKGSGRTYGGEMLAKGLVGVGDVAGENGVASDLDARAEAALRLEEV